MKIKIEKTIDVNVEDVAMYLFDSFSQWADNLYYNDEDAFDAVARVHKKEILEEVAKLWLGGKFRG